MAVPRRRRNVRRNERCTLNVKCLQSCRTHILKSTERSYFLELASIGRRTHPPPVLHTLMNLASTRKMLAMVLREILVCKLYMYLLDFSIEIYRMLQIILAPESHIPLVVNYAINSTFDVTRNTRTFVLPFKGF